MCWRSKPGSRHGDSSWRGYLGDKLHVPSGGDAWDI